MLVKGTVTVIVQSTDEASRKYVKKNVLKTVTCREGKNSQGCGVKDTQMVNSCLTLKLIQIQAIYRRCNKPILNSFD